MSAKISVIIKQPGRAPYKTAISATLENLQQTVGGYIETVTFATDLVAICNEEGRLLGMPHNCTIAGVEFVGPVIFAGIQGEEFGSLEIDFQSFKRMFEHLWEEA